MPSLLLVCYLPNTKRMSTFARMGNIGKNYINKGYCIDISFASIDCVVCLIVYTSLGYYTVVSEATEASMSMAVHEVQETQHYRESGEVQ